MSLALDAKFLGDYLGLDQVQGFTSFYYCCGKDEYFESIEALMTTWICGGEPGDGYND